MQKYIVLITITFVLTGCGFEVNATERTQIRANAAVAIAQAERDAAIGAAEAEVSIARAWAMVAVPLAIVIMGGVVAAIIVWWRGKIYHARATRAQASQLLTIESERDLKLYARQLGGRLAVDDQGYKVYLPGGQVQRLLPVNDR